MPSEPALTYFRLDLTIRDRLTLTVRAGMPQQEPNSFLLYLHPVAAILDELEDSLRKSAHVSEVARLEWPVPTLLAKLSCPASDMTSLLSQVGILIDSFG